MKRKEFIAQVEKLGLKVNEDRISLTVVTEFDPWRSQYVASVHKEHVGVFNTAGKEFLKLNKQEKFRLINILTEFSKTNPKQREDEKKYVVKSAKCHDAYIKMIDADGNYVGQKQNAITLSSHEKAQALATLVDGEVEGV